MKSFLVTSLMITITLLTCLPAEAAGKTSNTATVNTSVSAMATAVSSSSCLWYNPSNPNPVKSTCDSKNNTIGSKGSLGNNYFVWAKCSGNICDGIIEQVTTTQVVDILNNAKIAITNNDLAVLTTLQQNLATLETSIANNDYTPPKQLNQVLNTTKSLIDNAIDSL